MLLAAGVSRLIGMVFKNHGALIKGTLLGTPNREPQEYSRNIVEYKDPGRYIPIIYLLYSWGSRFGVPSRVPLLIGYSTYSDLYCIRAPKGDHNVDSLPYRG